MFIFFHFSIIITFFRIFTFSVAVVYTVPKNFVQFHRIPYAYVRVHLQRKKQHLKNAFSLRSLTTSSFTLIVAAIFRFPQKRRKTIKVILCTDCMQIWYYPTFLYCNLLFVSSCLKSTEHLIFDVCCLTLNNSSPSFVDFGGPLVSIFRRRKESSFWNQSDSFLTVVLEVVAHFPVSMYSFLSDGAECVILMRN